MLFMRKKQLFSVPKFMEWGRSVLGFWDWKCGR